MTILNRKNKLNDFQNQILNEQQKAGFLFGLVTYNTQHTVFEHSPESSAVFKIKLLEKYEAQYKQTPIMADTVAYASYSQAKAHGMYVAEIVASGGHVSIINDDLSIIVNKDFSNILSVKEYLNIEDLKIVDYSYLITLAKIQQKELDQKALVENCENGNHIYSQCGHPFTEAKAIKAEGINTYFDTDEEYEEFCKKDEKSLFDDFSLMGEI